ncbi:helix-turn-helix domain-containing protein [Cytobacillus spongiae]|jgi:uncharacterized protein YpbB|uniref:helix-turn-helix domain-containing protein n=1 Tax=Cytobacillus spongiae TaxID=2901381 RepID=UPI001F350B53|nr:helix-turn-helix domain-containing protein [Cytobacillus spongiae]UII54676.1 helix-turn-helix domain-containing protein [Cytobacillus spongiae]
MDLSFFNQIILHCLSRINGERTSASIFHLINGKKSSQTIQDAHLFGLTSLFGLFPNITRIQFENCITVLKERQLILEEAELYYSITEKGKEVLESLLPKGLSVYLKGWQYHHLTQHFWERLSLLIQVVSNLSVQNATYLPIQRNENVHNWLKYYISSFTNRKELAEQLHDELVNCLELANDIIPEVIIIRLTGSQHIGLTEYQAAEYLQMEPSYYHYEFVKTIHFILETAKNNKNNFPILYAIFSDLVLEVPLTQSTKKTFEMIEKGYSTKTIADIRRLKESTIEDHIVEITLNVATFDISSYVSKAEQVAILDAARRAPSKQLRHIRELTNDLNYFKIRLVLAKFGEKPWN